MAEAKQKMILPVMCVCVILIIATVAAINISIPKIESSNLHPSATQLLWIVDLYVIVFAGLLFPSGAIGDRYGRKTGLLCGLATYSAGSVVAALSSNIPLFLIARVVMGMGAAFIMPTTLAVITFVYKGKDRAHAISIWSACAAVGGGIGLLVGGAISQYLDWRYIFWLGAAIGVTALILAAIFTPKTPSYKRPVDLLGSGLLMLCFVSMLFGIIEAPENGWTNATNLIAFGVAIAAMVSFILSGLKRKDALFDPRVFKKPKLKSGAFGIAMSFFAMFSLYFVNAQFLQYSKNYSPMVTGLAILPATVTIFTFSQLSPYFTSKLGVKTILVGGTACIALGLTLISFCGPHTPYIWYALTLVVIAIGPGLSNPSFSDAIMSSFDEQQAGIGSAINDTTREVGSALGVAVMGTFIASRFPKLIPKEVLQLVGEKMAKGSVGNVLQKLQQSGMGAQHGNMDKVREAFAQSIHAGFRFGAAVALIAAAVLWWWYPKKSEERNSE